MRADLSAADQRTERQVSPKPPCEQRPEIALAEADQLSIGYKADESLGSW